MMQRDMMVLLLVLVLAAAADKAAAAAASAANLTAAAAGAGRNATANTSSTVPATNLAHWNQAFLLRVDGVPLSSAVFSPPPGCILNSDAQGRTFMDPQDASLNSCYYTSSSFARTWWQKLPGDLRSLTNSFCYALNAARDGPCIPGTANGTDRLIYPGRTNCSILTAALVADGLERVSRQTALATQPATGHFIAVLARAAAAAGGDWAASPAAYEGLGVGWQGDFAAVRKDNSSRWSYKVDQGPAFDRDLLNKTITDPEAAVFFGNFSVCGYFHFVPSKAVIGGLFGSGSSLEQLFRSMKAAADAAAKNLPEKQQGEAIRVELLPADYNATTDAALSALEQLAWEEEAEKRKAELMLDA